MIQETVFNFPKHECPTSDLQRITIFFVKEVNSNYNFKLQNLNNSETICISIGYSNINS